MKRQNIIKFLWYETHKINNFKSDERGGGSGGGGNMDMGGEM
jgi:hypothetical protein